MRCDDPPAVPGHGLRFDLSRVIRAPVDQVFAWWTDFHEDDPELGKANRLLARRIIRREGRRTWKRDVNAFGPLRIPVDSVITARPPDAWDLVAESPLHGVRATYRLVPDEQGSRLTGSFHVFARQVWVRPLVAARGGGVIADLGREWRGYINELESNFRGPSE